MGRSQFPEPTPAVFSLATREPTWSPLAGFGCQPAQSGKQQEQDRQLQDPGRASHSRAQRQGSCLQRELGKPTEQVKAGWQTQPVPGGEAREGEEGTDAVDGSSARVCLPRRASCTGHPGNPLGSQHSPDGGQPLPEASSRQCLPQERHPLFRGRMSSHGQRKAAAPLEKQDTRVALTCTKEPFAVCLCNHGMFCLQPF